MKRKSGFTLIELLGVIVILGIIVSIVLINLSKISEKNKESGKEKEIEEIKNAARDYFNTNEYYLTDLNNGQSIYVSLGTLVSEDYINSITDISTNKKFNKCDIVLVSKKNDKLTYEYIDNRTAINNGFFVGGNCSLKPVVIDSVVIKSTTTRKEETTNSTKKTTTTTTTVKTTTTTNITTKPVTNTTTKKTTSTTKKTTSTTKKTTKEVCNYNITQYDKGYLYSLKIGIIGKKINNFYYVVWNKKETSDTTNKQSSLVNNKCKLTDNLKKTAKKTGTDLITEKISMIKKNGKYVKNQYYCFAVKPVSGNTCNSWKLQYKHAHVD